MFLSNLSLENFKAIKNAEFNFGKINLITGETGEGKSGIIEAIRFLFTNSLQENIDEYVRWGSKKFNINSNFSHKGHKYSYNIEAGKGTDRELIIDGDENNPYLKSSASDYLATIIDPDLTLYSNISPQHKSTELLFEKPTPRLQKIKSLSKIDKINDVVNLMKDDVKELNEKIAKVEGELKTLREVKIDLLEEPILPDINIEGLKFGLKDLEEEKKFTEIEKHNYERYQQELKKYESAQQEILSYKKQIDSLQISLEQYQKSILVEIDFNEKEYYEIKDKIAELKTSISLYEKDLKNYEDIVKRIENLNIKLNTQKDLIKNNILKRLPREIISQEKVEEFYKDLCSLKSDVKTYEDQYQKIKTGKCPVDGRDCTLIDSESISIRLKECKEKSVLQNDEYLKLKKQFDDYNKILQENKEVQSKNLIYDKQCKDLEEQIDELKKVSKPETSELDSLKIKLLSIQKQFIDLGAIKTKKEEIDKINKDLKEKINKTEQEIQIVNLQIQHNNEVKKPVSFTTNFDEDRYNKLINQIENNRKEIEDYNLTLREIERVSELNKKLKERKRGISRDISIKDKNLLELRKEVGIIKETQQIMDKEFSAYLVELATRLIKEKMNEFFQRSYGKYEIDFRQDTKGIEFVYSENKSDWHSIGTLSGFEQSLFGVSFRVALCQLQNLNFLVLDEIDSDGSDYRSLKLFQTLLNEKQFEQFFIVTHNSSTKEFFYNLPECRVFEVSNGEIIT